MLYEPWSADAFIYRFPRMLYWWQANQWHWIGALDHRLDFSSTGFEWQMLPLAVLTRSDRFFFLINWLPLLLLPGLTFIALRTLGVNSRSSRRWMWLLPAAFCVALQSSSVQNDGYAMNFVLAAAAFAVIGANQRHLGMVLMSVLAAALLTGAKASNLPLMLPLGVLLLPALHAVNWFNWKVPLVSAVALMCSFAPMAFLCWKCTGDWTGDPSDQWNVKTHGIAAPMAANLMIFANDAVQPPCLPGSGAINVHLRSLNQSAAVDWMKHAHGEFHGVHLGEMAYEGGAGAGMGIAAYTILLMLASLTMTRAGKLPALPWAVRIAPWLAWFSFFVFLVKLGSDHSARIAAPYYPLLLVTLLRLPGAAALERTRISGAIAVVAAALVLPVIILTPTRPLVPMQTLAAHVHSRALKKLAEHYRFWNDLRHTLAPLQAQLPADCKILGYGAGFLDSPYELFKPLGSREVVELALPAGSRTPPPATMKYAIVTERGLQQRYGVGLDAWLKQFGGEIAFEFSRNIVLAEHTGAKFESWYLVKLNPPAGHPAETSPTANGRQGSPAGAFAEKSGAGF
jgi:hypothetical protein